MVKQTGSLKTSTVQCPFCQRVFNCNTAKQHIPKCEKTKNRPKPPTQKDDVVQQQRLRRLKYLRAKSVAAPSKTFEPSTRTRKKEEANEPAKEQMISKKSFLEPKQKTVPPRESTRDARNKPAAKDQTKQPTRVAYKKPVVKEAAK